MTERLPFHFSLSCTGEGNGNPLQCSCLENPRDGRAWWAHRVRHDWSNLAAAAAAWSKDTDERAVYLTATAVNRESFYPVCITSYISKRSWLGFAIVISSKNRVAISYPHSQIWLFLLVQTVKNPPVMWEIWILSLGWEDPLEKWMATHFSILAWEIPWTEERGGLQSLGSQSQTQLNDFHFHSHI